MSPLAMVKQLSGHIRTSGLRDFLVYAYEWSHPEAPGSQTFTDTIMDSISGFRVEASVAKLARAAGYEVREATRKEDAMGADLFIDGLPFDCKASQKGAAKHAREEHRKRSSSPNRFRSILLVPPITEKDFAGELVISDQTAGRLVETTNFREMIDGAVAKYLDMPQ